MQVLSKSTKETENANNLALLKVDPVENAGHKYSWGL